METAFYNRCLAFFNDMVDIIAEFLSDSSNQEKIRGKSAEEIKTILKSSISKKRSQPANGRWRSEEEYEKESGVCAYQPKRGQFKGYYCCLPAVNTEEAKSKEELRCKECIKKKSTKKTQSPKIVPFKPIADITIPEKLLDADKLPVPKVK